ncbi:PilN domain-containing protein [Methylomagnum sp.]
MLKLDQPVNLDVAKFFRWWGGELAFLVPAKLLKLLGGAPDYLLLGKDEQGLTATHRGPDGERPLGRFALDESGAQAREQLLADNPELAEAKVVLRLTAGQALGKTLKLPLAAEENLAQVVAFEMDRLTPFKADQVYFGARVVARSTATRQLSVEMILTPRAKLDALLDELATWGWRPDSVDMAGPTTPGLLNLLPEKYRPAKSRWPRLTNIALSVVILSLLAALAVLPILSARSEAEALEEQVRKTGKIAKEVEALRQQADNLLHQTRFLQDKKLTEPVLVDMLEELSRLIPDNTWLNGLQYKDRRVVMQGQSPSASKLIELLEASGYFKNTSFVSPVTKDTGSGLERFQLASDVINGRFSEKSATERPAAQKPAADSTGSD